MKPGDAAKEENECVQDREWPLPKTVFDCAIGVVAFFVGCAGLIVVMIGAIDGWNRVGYVLDLMFRR